MQVLTVEKGEGDGVFVTFARDGHEVRKHIRIPTFYQKTCKTPDELRNAFACSFQRAAREADRDIAFKLHGKEFRKHCEFTSNFWQPMPESELNKLFD